MRTIALLLLFISSTALAQNQVNGRVIDDQGEPLPYTTVVLMTPQDSTLQFFGVSKVDGTYQIRNIKNGEYLMQFSTTGMQTFYRSITFPLESENLGDQELVPSLLEEVIIQAELVPITFKTDTLEFNSKAFQTRPGASVEELLEKLPGVDVDESGNIQAQGENVTKVLVDGKEFFGNDPKVATKNLPAEALEKVQVFNRKSEETVFSGIDDGTREKTINLVLNEDHKNGYFGRIEGGLGTNETYKADGRVYRFSENVQIGALGMANNINQFGFTNRGNSEFGQRVQGENQSGAGGLNLLYNKNSMNRYFISYLGNTNTKDLEEITATENFVPQGTYLQENMLQEVDKNTTHNVNFGFRHSFSTNNRMTLDGNLTFEDGDLSSIGQTYSGIEDSLINSLQNNTGTLTDVKGLDVDLTHIAKFNEGKTQLMTDFTADLSRDDQRLDWLNITTLYYPPDTVTLDQFRVNILESSNWTLAPSWVQKIGKRWTSTLGVGLGQSTQSIVRQEGLIDTSSEVEEFNIPSFETVNNRLRPSLTFRHVANKSNLSLTGAMYVSRFDKTLTDSLNVPALTSNDYAFFLPSVRYRNDYSSGKRVEANYFTNINMPDVNQLYPVPNTLNILSIYEGNIDLEPEKNHTVQLTWSIFDEFSFTSFFVRLMGRYTEDKISMSQYINEDLVQVVQPVNVKDNTLLTSQVDFGKPWRALGINFNLSWRENWNQGIVFVNTVENTNTVLTHTLNGSFENRSKSKLGYEIGGSIAYSNSQFSVDEHRNNNYWNSQYYATVRYNPSRRWYFEAKANVTSYNDDNFGEAVQVPLITSRFSYSFMQAEKASVSLTGFDLLNKYIGFQQLSTSNYLQEKEWNTVGRYVMLAFSYQFR